MTRHAMTTDGYLVSGLEPCVQSRSRPLPSQRHVTVVKLKKVVEVGFSRPLIPHTL